MPEGCKIGPGQRATRGELQYNARHARYRRLAVDRPSAGLFALSYPPHSWDLGEHGGDVGPARRSGSHIMAKSEGRPMHAPVYNHLRPPQEL